MLIPHKKSRKTRGCAIPRAHTAALHCIEEARSACCALIEAQPVWRHPRGAKTGGSGAKKEPADQKKKDLGKQKRKCRYKKTSFAPQKDTDSPLTGLIRITLDERPLAPCIFLHHSLTKAVSIFSILLHR